MIGIGLDLVEVGRFEEGLARHGDRLKKRLFSEGERRYCEARGEGVRAQHYAVRFAAKEAWIKATGIAHRWHEIEVVNEPITGKPNLVLHGRTEEDARERGIEQVLVTLTHTKNLAMAHVMVIAELRSQISGLGSGSLRSPGKAADEL